MKENRNMRNNAPKTRVLIALLAFIAMAASSLLVAPRTFADKGGTPQASITLQNCGEELCHKNNTSWTLTKDGSLSGNTITWSVTATKGATNANMLTVDGFVSITNTGTAPATIGNIVVNLQRKPSVKWVTASSDVANAFAGDAATTANLCSGASSEGLSSFTENSCSGPLEFTDADSNTIFSLTPQQTIAVGATVNLLYSATFNNTCLGIPAGEQVRMEVIVTFGNSGSRGGSGSSCTNIDVSGNGSLSPDETNVRSVPCRVTRTVPVLQTCNSSVTLTDTGANIAVNGSGVTEGNFQTDIGGGSGTEVISDTATRTVSVDTVCTPPGSATMTNAAHLDGEDSSIFVQTGVDPLTLQPVGFTFPCCIGIHLEAHKGVAVSCDALPPEGFHGCTYTKGGYAGPGLPGQLFDSQYLVAFPTGLTIGINDGAGPKHNATWTGDATGRSALKTYLTSAAGGPNTALTGDTSNATSTTGGGLPRQSATLTLNVAFATGFGNLKLCNLAEGSTIGSWTLTAAQAVALNGTTINQVLVDANNALGGNGLPGYVGSFGDLNQLVTALNESYDNCAASAFATANLCQP
jgi:hypothetical protein